MPRQLSLAAGNITPTLAILRFFTRDTFLPFASSPRAYASMVRVNWSGADVAIRLVWLGGGIPPTKLHERIAADAPAYEGV